MLFRSARSAWRRCRAVCNSGGKAHRNIFHPRHGAIRQPCGCPVCRSYARYLPSAGIFFCPAAPKNGGGTEQKYNFIQYLQKRFRTGHTVCPDGVCRKGTGKPPAARRECVTAQAWSRTRHGRGYHGGKPGYSRPMPGNRNRRAGIRRILLPLRGRPALSLPAEAGRGKSGQHRAPRKLTT